jgi:hypothetical protein
MAGYWLKLFTEILDDPKYNRLSDTAKLGMYELLLLGKNRGNDGDLPTLSDIAFYTRRSEDWWQPVIEELKGIKFLIEENNNLVIRQFATRQGAVSGSERARQSRERTNKPKAWPEPDAYDSQQNPCETHAEPCKKNGDVEVDVEVDVEKDVEKDVDVVNNDIEIINQEFENSSGLSRANCTQKEKTKWDESLIKLSHTGVSPEIISKSIAALKAKGGYVIAGPWSIIKAVQIEMASARQTVPKDDARKYIEGPYADFIQH